MFTAQGPTVMGDLHTTFKGAVRSIVRDLELVADYGGLTLSRWSCALGSYRVRITWAVHSGPRPDLSTQLKYDAIKCVLLTEEGTTDKCKAYLELKMLLAKTIDRIGMSEREFEALRCMEGLV